MEAEVVWTAEYGWIERPAGTGEGISPIDDGRDEHDDTLAVPTTVISGRGYAVV